MKQILSIIICMLLLCTGASSQPYNNEWIDYNKTYYKFGVGSNSLYRITLQTLQSLGLQNTPAAQFQLWHMGKQVPLYIPGGPGPLGAGGYIEFYATMNDGTLDKGLYRHAVYQLNDQVSLQTDTAAYFLTVNPQTAANVRMADAVNNLGGIQPPAEPWFWYNKRINYRNQINRGEANTFYGESIYSSSYDKGEFFTSNDINNNNPLRDSLRQLFPFNGGPAATLSTALVGQTVLGYNRRIAVQFNGQQVISQSLLRYETGVYQATVPMGPGNGAEVNFTIQSPEANDRYACNYVDLRYARQFNFGGDSRFAFTLPASNQGQYLEISNYGSAAPPVLWDLTNMRRYEGVVQGTVVRFRLNPSNTAASLVLHGTDAGASREISVIRARTFINYALLQNQGDYLFITHQNILAGSNAVNEYMGYRASAAGGGFNVKMYMIDQLVDQYAFGIKQHPLSVRNFLRFARQNYAAPVKNVLLVGKGVTYDDYRRNEPNRSVEDQNLVPTWGWPASDNLLVSNDLIDPTPAINIGRIAVINGPELSTYLSKVRKYENAQQALPQTVAARGWMKTSVHVVGANNNINLENILASYQNGYANIIQDTAVGARAEQFNRLISGPVSPQTNARMEALWNGGIGIINYFGHSSATALDYNINDPMLYNNDGKYPVFCVNGCNAGNFFSYDFGRFQNTSSLAEKFVLAPERGSIAFIASTHFGVTSFLDALNLGFYRSVARINYGGTLSEHVRNSILYAKQFSGDSLGLRLHLEETTLHGDPALRVNGQPKPDFAVEEGTVSISPNIVNIADNQFTLKTVVYNLGRANADSVLVQVRRQYPAGNSEIVFSSRLAPIRFADSISINLPVLSTRDRGENRITVSVDPANVSDEMSEQNNVYTRSIFIQEDAVKPVTPFQYALTGNAALRLYASTAGALEPSRSYQVEIDTTALFNSSFKRSQTVQQSGGIIEINPSIGFVDSTVYYWRIAAAGTQNPVWGSASFQYAAGANKGLAQAHYFQHLRSQTNQIRLDSASRRWQFIDRQNFLQIVHSVFGTSGFEPSDFQIGINGSTFTQSACLGRSIIFNVIDPVTLAPYFNQPQPSTTGTGTYGGFMGSAQACQQTGSNLNFEFGFWDTTGRRRIRDFMDWIPSNAIVTVRLILDQPYAATPWASVWKADDLVYGQGNTMYERLRQAGMVDVDSFYYPRTFTFSYKKNGTGYAAESRFTGGLFDKIIFNRNFASPDSSGTITSVAFGKAQQWKRAQWQITGTEPSDRYQLELVGIGTNGQETVLNTFNTASGDADISQVSVQTHPQVKLRLRLSDRQNYNPAQLRFWRVLYDPLPEGAMAANIFTGLTKDSVELGEPIDAAIVFKNISETAFADSLSVVLQVQDANNAVRSFALPKVKRLNPGDTALIRQRIDSRGLSGSNTLFMEVNPNLAVPEQERFNNLLYKTVVVNGDQVNPLLDVTFDGMHILNNDIVNAKPRIVAKLKDNSRFLLLDDTSLVTVQLRWPSGQLRRYAFGSDTLRFVPATTGADNSASVEFNPALLVDGDYELYIRGKDKSNNAAGVVEYRVGFKVYNKPMISQLFNYPNPFTTSTAFVFTLTGSEIPSNLRIQILTITGKIVREITKAELGPLRIGRNITEFKWDGTDAYGQPLGNGVYLYRVITNLNGKSLDKFPTNDVNGNGVNTDQYFNAGYGKMYLMR